MAKKPLTLEQNTEIVKEWLTGDYSKSALSKKWGITPGRLMKIVSGEPRTNTLIEKEHFELVVAKEQEKIADIKEKVLNFLEQAVVEGNEAEEKMQYVSKIMDIMNQMDRIQRLNRGEATQITKNETQETNINVNVADVIKELKTSDDKKRYLAQQMEEVKFNS